MHNLKYLDTLGLYKSIEKLQPMFLIIILKIQINVINIYTHVIATHLI